MWIERNDWMIRDDENGNFQCDPQPYGKFSKTGQRAVFTKLHDAIAYCTETLLVAGQVWSDGLNVGRITEISTHKNHDGYFGRCIAMVNDGKYNTPQNINGIHGSGEFGFRVYPGRFNNNYRAVGE